MYVVVEDDFAVNRGGSLEFRRKCDGRYEASKIMRRLLNKLSWFWTVPAIMVGVGLLAFVAIADNWVIEVAYGVLLGLPWAWAGLWAWTTIRWVRILWEKERRTFADGG